MLRVNRRHFVSGTAADGALMSRGLALRASAYTTRPELPAALSDGARATAILDALAGKKPLIKAQLPGAQLQDANRYFRDVMRYHLSDIPEVDAKTWKLAVGVNTPITEMVVN